MKVLLGVSGGVAAYKAAELVRVLQRRGVDVQVAMTKGAEEFVRALTFAALTGRQVLTTLWEPTVTVEGAGEPFGIEHIDIAQTIDALVIAPATANTIARLAGGFAEDVLGAVFLATKAPVIVAPAMNVNMWEHPATRANIALLRARGVAVVEPEPGELACGMVGAGRLAGLEAIADAVVAALVHSDRARPQDLAGETFLVTAGGTRERIDPVRFIGNRSSGKMGHALAEAAAARGAKVTLVTASPLQAHGCEIVRVTTAAEMRDAVLARLPQVTVVVKAAAVSDYHVREVAPQKIKRDGAFSLQLEPTEDIVAEVVRHKQPGTLVIAFAAETENVLANAQAKLRRKRVDALFANDVSAEGCGFEGEGNAGWFCTAESCDEITWRSKRATADAILDRLVALRIQVLS